MDTATTTSDGQLAGPDKRPSVLVVLACKCPRCRRGAMFSEPNPWKLKRTMRMNPVCSVCGQPFNLEVGFYYGASYVAYALTVGLCILTFVLWWLLIGFSFTDNRFLYWIIFNAVFLIAMQPYLMRLARAGWLYFFVRYDPTWRSNPPRMPERTNRDQEHNW